MKTLLARILSSLRAVQPRARTSVLLWLFCGVLLFGWVMRSRAMLNLNITPSGTNVLIAWTNAGVALQGSLNATGTWYDVTGAASPYLTPATNKTAFFRLRQTSSSPTQITDIEPAFLATNGGTFYLLGTNFGSDSQVFLNGNPASVTFISSNLLSVGISALPAGAYNVSVVNGGQTNAMLADGLTVESAPQAGLEVPPGMSPAVTAAGELRQSSVDLVVPAGIGPSFVLARSYRSRIGPTNSPIGHGWDFSSDISIRGQDGANLVVNDGTGRADTYFPQGNGTYSRAGFFQQGTFAGSVFTLTFADKSKWVFNALNALVAPGKIAQNIDRNGNIMTYAYNPSGQLTNVTDAVGRATQFTYNGAGQLTSVQDYAGRTITYTYDGNSNLSTATTPAVTGTPNGNNFPSGKTTTYSYDPRHHLTSVIDPTGTVVMTNQYSTDTNPAAADYDHLVSSALGTNPPTVFSYAAQTPTPTNRYATTQIYVNDPVGNVTMVYYDSQNRPRQIRQYTGRAMPGVAVTANTNQPMGQLRTTDPAFYQTTCAYDLNSLPTQITHPRGDTTAMVYECDVNSAAPVRERGNLLIMTRTPAPGVPADQTQRVDQWQYQPGFGTGEGGRVYERQFRPGRPTFGGIAGDWKPAKPDSDMGLEGVICSFPTNHIDPRGNVTSANYDPNGNLLAAQPPGIATGFSYAYNAAGQLTSLTHPADANGRRQQDTFNYHTNGAQNGYLQSDVEDAGGNLVPGQGLTTSYSYDPYGNVTNIVDPRGNATQMVYNQLDQLMQISSPPGPAGLPSQATFAYDAAGTDGGRVISQSVLNFDQNGNAEASSPLTTTYGYDAVSRLTSVTNEVGASAAIVTRHAYDASGELTSVMSPLASSGADAFNTMQYSYDERSLPFQQISASGSTNQSTTQYNYDANANLASVNEGLEGTPRATTVVADGFASSADACLAMAGEATTTFRPDPATKLAAGLAMAGGGGALSVVNGDVNGDGVPDNFEMLGQYVHKKLPGRMKSGVFIPGSGGGKGPMSAAIGDLNGDGIPDDVEMLGQYVHKKLPGRMKSSVFIPGNGGGKGPMSVAIGDMNGDCQPELGMHVGPRRSGLAMTAGTADGAGVFKTSTGGQICDGAFAFPGGGAGPGSSGPLVAGLLANVPNSGTSSPSLSGPSIAGSETSGFVAVPDRARSRFDSVPQQLTYQGRLADASSITDPMGNVITNHYDANDNLVSTTVNGTNGIPSGGGNMLLYSATAQYDGLDRLTNHTEAIIDAQGNVLPAAQTSAVLSDNDETTALTDANGHTTTYTYDTVSRPGSITDPKGNSTSYTYDPNSNVTAVTNRLKSDLGTPDLVFVRTFSYDALDRVTNSMDNAGNTTSQAYDSRGNATQTTDARGIVSQYQYDGLSRLTAAGVDMNNNGNAFDIGDIVTSYVYDGNSRLTSRTDPNGNVTSYAYDSLNRHTATTNADATVSSVAYDVHGNVILAGDANHTVVTYSYDSDNRVAAKGITPGSGVAATTTAEQYSYDGLGRVVYAANNKATNSFTYDSLSRRLTETQNGLTGTNTYDAVGNCLTVAYPGGRQLGYAYDAANLCRAVTLLADPTGDTPGLISSNAYVGGLFQSCSNRNGTHSLVSYDGSAGSTGTGDSGWGRISSIRHFGTNGTVIDAITLTYDAAQNKTGRTAGFTGLTNRLACLYDNAGRLTNAVVTTNSVTARDTVYNFDTAGNRTNVTGEACSGAYTMNSTIPPGDFEMNRYTTTPCDSRTYDGNGDLASVSSTAGPVTNQYDYAGRLVLVQTVSYGTGVPVLTTVAGYAYDALGRRVSKTVYSGGLPSTTTEFLYNRGSVVEERNGNTTMATYVYCDGVQNGNETDVDGVQSGNETDLAGGVCLVMSRSGQDYYLHADDQGNTLALTATGGTVVERCDYDDYGAVTFLTSEGNPTNSTSSTVGNPYCWRGLRLDAETGLQNDDGAGYFEPQTGRELLGRRNHPPMLSASRSWNTAGNNPWSGGTDTSIATALGDGTGRINRVRTSY